MFAEERHQLIGGMLADYGKVTVADLSGRFGITRETVRRDLAQLESAGVLRRVHGGAVAASKASTTEESHTVRTSRHFAEKRRIAQRALDLLPHGPVSAVLDAGTTTELLAEAMVDRIPAQRAAEILAVTHALPIANRLAASPDFQLELVGGRIRGLTSAAIGARAVEQFQALRPDIAFLGTNGVHYESGSARRRPRGRGQVGDRAVRPPRRGPGRLLQVRRGGLRAVRHAERDRCPGHRPGPAGRPRGGPGTR